MPTLKQKGTTGIRWITLNTVCTTLLQFIQLAVLGRLFGPEVFGIMAMIMIVVEFARVFAEMGLSTAIIQRKEPTKNELSTLYWINVYAGLILYTILYFSTPLIAMGFKTKELNAILPVVSVIFLIAPFGVQFQTLLRKSLRFDITTKINIFSTIIGTIIAISIAVMGYGVWALVYGQLCNVIFRTFILLIIGKKMGMWPRIHFCWADTQGYISFGLFRVGAMAVNQFNSRVDQLVIGAFMGPLTLGYYNIAFRLVMKPIQKVNPILTQIAFPVFSIIQNETTRLKRGFLHMIRLLMFINAPILIGASAIAPVAVPFLLGDKWIASVPIVQVLAFYTLIRSLGNAGGSLIVAKGKANWSFYWNIALLLIIPVSIYCIIINKNSIILVALTLVFIQSILFFCHYCFFIRNLIGPCLSEYLINIGVPMILSLIMGGIVILCGIPITHLTLPIKFLILVGIGAISYIILSWFFQKQLFYEVLNLIPVRFKILHRQAV